MVSIRQSLYTVLDVGACLEGRPGSIAPLNQVPLGKAFLKMSWKLAELKWRQELGLYESRWEMESSALPIERKRAIQAFERAQCRTLSQPESPRRRPTQASPIREASLGNHSVCPAEFPADSQHPRPTPSVPDGQLISLSPIFPLFRSPSTSSDKLIRARRAHRKEHQLDHRIATQRRSLPSLISYRSRTESVSDPARASPAQVQGPHGEPAPLPPLSCSSMKLRLT